MTRASHSGTTETTEGRHSRRRAAFRLSGMRSTNVSYRATFTESEARPVREGPRMCGPRRAMAKA
jgi:hypothetical protein